MNNKFLILSIISFNFLAACSNDQNEVQINPSCKHEFRGAFDIGSSTTKIQIAHVELCENVMPRTKEVYRQVIPIKYGEKLAESKLELPKKILDSEITAMRKARMTAESYLKEFCTGHKIDDNDCKVNKWRGIATEVFRKAINSREVIDRLSNEILDNNEKILIKILNPSDEVFFGLYPIYQIPGFDPDTSIVWDLGETDSKFMNYDYNSNQMPYSLIPLATSTIKANFNSELYNKLINPITKVDEIYNYMKNDIIYYFNYYNKENEIRNINIDFNSFSKKKVYVIGETLSRIIPSAYNNEVIIVNKLSQIKNINEIKPYTFFSKEKLNEIYSLYDKDLDNYFGAAIPDKSEQTDLPINLLLTDLYTDVLKTKTLYPIRSDGTDTIVIHPSFSDDDFWKNSDQIQNEDDEFESYSDDEFEDYSDDESEQNSHNNNNSQNINNSQNSHNNNNSQNNNQNDNKVTYNPLCKHEFRGAFDIGSSTTKIQLAHVELCNNKKPQTKEVYRQDVSVKYGEELAKSNYSFFPDDIVVSGITAMREARKTAQYSLKDYCKKHKINDNECKVNKWRGIATEDFSKATNWSEVIDRLSNETFGNHEKILIKLLSLSDKAFFDFYPISQIPGFKPDKSIVWDLGEASSQFMNFDSNLNKIKIISLPYYSTSNFKAFINYYISKKTPNKPINPIIRFSNSNNKYDRDFANEVQAIFKNKLNSEFKKINIKDFSKMNVYVIGGTLSRLIPSAHKNYSDYDYKVNKMSEIKNIDEIKPYTFFSKNEINKICSFNDNQLVSLIAKGNLDKSYVIDLPINLLLTELYTDVLGIKTLYPIRSDGTDTIIIHPNFSNDKYWENNDNSEMRI